MCGQCWDDCGLRVGHLAGVHCGLYYLPGMQVNDKKEAGGVEMSSSKAE